ncbi:ribonuclease Y [Adlercreutzia agrestimuris]|uniref:ribonuclease Y n=1 Tax=Adlercreutzia agrestimuris TaxID=2941324 RepID=UPI00203BF6F1|nr:ribonuclease Y [Adlercreutzia agrestimuris]
MPEVIWLVVGAIVGVALGFIITRFVVNASSKRAAEEAENLVADAKRQAETMRREAVVEAKDEVLKMKQEAEAENKERLREVRAAENRVLQREESLDRRVESLDAREHQISSMQGQLDRRERNLAECEQEVNVRLERVAGLTPEEAKAELLDTLKDEVAHESAAIIRDAENRAKLEADKRARSILSLAIQRVAADHTAETTVSTIHIPSDDLKGRIIGREGRNIRSFEQLTGTNLIIDDTPECVTISCFDPVRREIGRVTMENLVADGRIHPARIEEMFSKAEAFVNQRVQEAGEQATFDTGIHDLHPELVRTLGRLRYRTSYGQNVLNHSLEVAYLAGVMASELGLDPVPAKRAGLLHDLGKAVDHEVEGSHAVIGADLARRFGEKQDIVHAIEAHHNDVEPSSVLAVLVQAADAISAARPGARKETLDAYIKRLEKLEEIANSYKGVERTYAIQAGREVRVMVEPDQVDEATTTVLAHDIAQRIENELQYPGQVKVVVIRESRAVGIAK